MLQESWVHGVMELSLLGFYLLFLGSSPSLIPSDKEKHPSPSVPHVTLNVKRSRREVVGRFRYLFPDVHSHWMRNSTAMGRRGCQEVFELF